MSLKPAVCLTFDDAYADFYYYVFPLLKKFKLPAVLGIPTSWIQEHTSISPQKRLSITYPHGLTKELQASHSPLCTWPELQEMSRSGYMQPASHSATHINLVTASRSQLTTEINTSKQILQQKLHQPIDTFIYPFGQMTKEIHKVVHAQYKYGMRIGSAVNSSWLNKSGLFYRLDADTIWRNNRLINSALLIKATWKYYLNLLRKK